MTLKQQVSQILMATLQQSLVFKSFIAQRQARDYGVEQPLTAVPYDHLMSLLVRNSNSVD